MTKRRRNRYFNTTGPCFPDMHYMLPAKDRLVGASLDRYINDHLYWVLHAPRQTGKTTFLQSWMREINSSGDKYGPEGAVACYVSVECCKGTPEPDLAMPALVEAIREYTQQFGLAVPDWPEVKSSLGMLTEVLCTWARMVAPKKLVILFDDVEVLEGPAMISFLRQLRGAFASRGVGKFPVSVALVGLRDLKDYVVTDENEGSAYRGVPFNIKEDIIKLRDFNLEEIEVLVNQHTEETGQVFTAESLERIWHYTSGQPGLVNALCRECVLRVVPVCEQVEVTEEHINVAAEPLIASIIANIDSLVGDLGQDSIRKVIQPIITGGISAPFGRNDRDVELCMDLGLVVWDGTLKVSNAIYREVIARHLSQDYQDNIVEPEIKWKNDDGSLDMDALMIEFQKFWRRHADIWEEKADYTEAFPHLLLMAFMQRIVNAGGTIEREYAAGRGRVDLCIHFGGHRNIIEIKLVHAADDRKTTLQEGLQQISRYADTCGERTITCGGQNCIQQTTTCDLVIFDRRPEFRSKPWEERLSREQHRVPIGAVAEKTAAGVEKATASETAERLINVSWC